MKSIAVGVFALTVAVGSSALAADMAVKAPPLPIASSLNWAGYYAGLNLGLGWSDPSVDLASFSAPFAAAVAAGQVPLSIPLSQKGVIGGGQVGYNWQLGTFVIGLEADFQGSGIRGSNSFFYAGPAVPTLTDASSQLDWFGTVRGRLGFAVTPNVLAFATGGFGYGLIRSSVNLVGNPAAAGNFHGSVDDFKGGWAIGGGAEWAILPRWTVKAEYLHIDLGQSTVTINDPAFPTSNASYTFRNRYDIVRAGVDYHF